MIAALVGGQFGSEGKGLIAGHIAHEFGHHIRVGAANAGHTVYTRNEGEHSDADTWPWEKHVMQQIPCAAYANPDAKLYIGPGAQISPEIFHDELRRLTEWRLERGLRGKPVIVDPRAHVITNEHIEREQESGLAERIGSTSTIAREGIGAAQAARVMREESCMLAAEFYRDRPRSQPLPIILRDVPMALNHGRLKEKGDGTHNLLLEGTQGTGLSLTTGFFPYTTSRNTTAAGLCADCGVPPGHLDRVILVVRTYPIRVAGPSGPFYHDSDEIEWADIGVDPIKEKTTVTKKVRRVATFSITQLVEAASINGATEVAITFCDYLDQEISGKEGTVHWDQLVRYHPSVARFVSEVAEALPSHVPVTMLGTGPHSVLDLNPVY